MVTEGTIEILIQQDGILPEPFLLVAEDGGHRDGGLYKAAFTANLMARPVGKEREAAAAYPLRLLIDKAIGRASDRETHAHKPCPHAATELDLPAARADRLALQEKQDEPGVRTVGQ